MKVYINTIPKAGTYFTAEFLAQLGFTDTGFHVGLNDVLRTKDFPLSVNIETPTATIENRPYAEVIRGLKDGEVAFGHFPVALRPLRFPGLRFICTYRHPRKTLMSEFVDFRYRRRDVRWMSRDNFQDDDAAFVAFLRQKGPVQMDRWNELLGIRRLVLLRVPGFSPRRYAFCSFDDLLEGDASGEALARWLGRDPARVPEALARARAAETKTKATGLEVDRKRLWSAEAERAYSAIGFERKMKAARRLGLNV
ncbi:hypothetical protein [Maritimibacter sp. UBA3975]|uniref:hypothetical protein n=1 Tax=Maritimibacter sp. UBA3975 TaxID=1946833 RepID=UPI000C0A366B|nr:hypothetical protein [Maritimibacter sp. UBA3975]MAM62601.1 hypothetical protein [Maritimibacter sp.]|tara:strand:+ start:3225 stop:3983 length:759 start_codon:yes stop_codon:yes gene_type:complete